MFPAPSLHAHCLWAAHCVLADFLGQVLAVAIGIPRKVGMFPLRFSLLASLASLVGLALQVASRAPDHGVTRPGSFTHSLVAPDRQLTGVFRLPTRSSASDKNGRCTFIIVGKWHALLVLTEERSALSA